MLSPYLKTKDLDGFDDVNGAALQESFVSKVAYSTGGYQPPIIARPTVFGALCRSGIVPKVVRAVERKAIEDGDIFRWTDEDTGKTYLGLDDADALVDRIESYCERREDPNEVLIGIANRRVQRLRDNMAFDGETTDSDDDNDNQ